MASMNNLQSFPVQNYNKLLHAYDPYFVTNIAVLPSSLHDKLYRLYRHGIGEKRLSTC